jgi:hypothetical protein
LPYPWRPAEEEEEEGEMSAAQARAFTPIGVEDVNGLFVFVAIVEMVEVLEVVISAMLRQEKRGRRGPRRDGRAK